MNANPVPDVRVTVPLLWIEYTALPNLTLQGAELLQPLPITSPAAPLRVTVNAVPTPSAAPDPDSFSQVFAATHAKRLASEVDSVRRYSSATLHVAGSCVPVFTGRVKPAAVKSTSFAWLLRSIRVWPKAAGKSALNMMLFRMPIIFSTAHNYNVANSAGKADGDSPRNPSPDVTRTKFEFNGPVSVASIIFEIV